jgi:hypothetical protein
MSFALARIRLRKAQANSDRPSWPLASWKQLRPPFASDMFVWQPLPFTFATGLGRKQAVRSISEATWRAISL